MTHKRGFVGELGKHSALLFLCVGEQCEQLLLFYPPKGKYCTTVASSAVALAKVSVVQDHASALQIGPAGEPSTVRCCCTVPLLRSRHTWLDSWPKLLSPERENMGGKRITALHSMATAIGCCDSLLYSSARIVFFTLRWTLSHQHTHCETQDVHYTTLRKFPIWTSWLHDPTTPPPPQPHLASSILLLSIRQFCFL